MSHTCMLSARSNVTLNLATLASQVDGTKERVLLSRFHVEGFPMIFHVNGAETRRYSGKRTLQKVICTFCAQ